MTGQTRLAGVRERLAGVWRGGGEARAFSERHGALIRKALIPLFSRINPGDITIRHQLTGDPFRLQSFAHRGYWFHGARREAETVAFYQRLLGPTDTIIEVGAHIGYQTLIFAAAASRGRVVAFEPGPNNLPYLRSNAEQCPNIEVRAQAVSDRPGRLTFWCEDLTGQNNSLVGPEEFRPSQLESVNRYAVDVEGVTLDAVGAELAPVTFVKIDVEAAEDRVVAGGMDLVRRDHPGLMIELSTRHASGIYATLVGLGYHAFRPSGAPIATAADIGFNTFFLHPSRHGELIADLDRGA